MSLDVKWTSNDEKENKLLEEIIESDDSLKGLIINYIGNKLDPENDKITVSMIVDILAGEFPELTLALAEENWIRGYQQGLEDQKVLEEDAQ